MNARRFVAFVASFAIVVAFASFDAGAEEMKASWKALFIEKVSTDPETGVNFSAMSVRDANGNVRKITPDRWVVGLGGASWSPDGTEIVYSGLGVRVMNSDGSDDRLLAVTGYNVSVSQTHIVFQAGEGNRMKIWALARSSNATPVAIAEGANPTVSFDGKLVTFDSGGVFVVGIDGVGSRLVVDDAENPQFLPDGRLLVLRDRIHPEMWIVDPAAGGRGEFLAYGRDFSVTKSGWIVYDYDDPVRGWYAIRSDGTDKHLIEPEWRSRRGFRAFGDLSPGSRPVVPRGKLPTQWADLKRQ